ncbi:MULTISPECIES: IS3 family transposase [Roseomonas]|uniref:IS3 family transposase n=1 Tax=Roseomonas TaxID=125216 RepID=UPI001D011D26|nr:MULTISPECIES: IS3 family transposase [Roseomonas]
MAEGSGKRRFFPEAFKLEAVAAVRGGRSVSQVAAELGLPDRLVRSWLRWAPTGTAVGSGAPALAVPTPPAAPARRVGPSPAEQAAEIGRLRREVERLRMERDILKPSGAHLRPGDGPEVSYGFIRDHVAVFPVAILCEVLGVSRSGYYDWARRPESRQAAADRVLAAEIRATHADSRGRYGSPRVHAALRAQGRRVGRKRVARLMRGMGLSARRGRRFRCTTDSRHAFPVAPNLLDRDFTAAAPDRVWLADLTYLWTAEGWLYLAVVLDLCTRRVVGWAMADHLGHELALAALDMAIACRRPAPGLLHHADRGVQYAAHGYRRRLAENGMLCSMSRKGNCWDNAPMESFYATLKGELVEQRDYLTRDEARADVFQYLEGFYNRRRLHSALGYLTPEQKAATFQTAASAA